MRVRVVIYRRRVRLQTRKNFQLDPFSLDDGIMSTRPCANLAVASYLRGQGRSADAFERLRHASHGTPENFEIQMSLVAAAYELGYFDEAASAFRRAVELNRENGVASFNLGTVLLAQESYSEEEAVLEPVVSSEEPHDGAAFNLTQA